MPHELNPALEIWQSNYSSSGPFSTPSANLFASRSDTNLIPPSLGSLQAAALLAFVQLHEDTAML